MKKAKIMLTAIGLFAIIGGALAFKAHRGGGLIYVTTAGAPNACTVTVRTLTTIPNDQPATTRFATTVFNGTCRTLTVYPTAL